jgi:hypothetical protein
MKAIKINEEFVFLSKNMKPLIIDGSSPWYGLFSQSDEFLLSLGFKDVLTPEIDSRIEVLSEMKLIGDVYSYDVLDRTITQTLAELKAQKIENLNSVTGRKLEDIQWHWDRDKRTEGAKPVSQEIKDLDVSIRLENDNIKSEINALTTKKAVLIFDLPNSNIS